MKRYVICLFLFIGVSGVCLMAGHFLTREYGGKTMSQTRETPAVTMGTKEETATAVENLAAANKEQVKNELGTGKKEFYLVSEDGFLLVFGKDRETICLYTHIPLMDFPESEQERLREGIWFSDMMDVIHYLESFTS